MLITGQGQGQVKYGPGTKLWHEFRVIRTSRDSVDAEYDGDTPFHI